MGVYIVFAGAAANILGTSSYFFGTLRGTTKPNRVSWFFWAVAAYTAGFASLFAGVGWAAFPVFVGATLCLLVLLASFVNPRAYWKLGRFDYLCGFFAALALMLWFFTNEPTLTIACAILCDCFATLPTITKAWKEPSSESPWTYAGGLLNGLSAFFVIKVWDFSSVAFPLDIMALAILILCAMYHKKLFP